jgi:hypothetical protein
MTSYDPKLFIDASVDTNDIDDSLPDETICQKIREEYLRASTVTILLVGTETKKRKYIDRELYSSMINGQKNRESGILVITLPSTDCEHCTAAHPREKGQVYQDLKSWTTFWSQRTKFL